jgi:hypothetical protein
VFTIRRQIHMESTNRFIEERSRP